MNKRIYSIIVCLVITLCCGCQGQGYEPKEVVQYFLNAYKTQDEVILKQYSLWDEHHIHIRKLQKQDYLPNVEPSLQQQVYNKMIDFDFDIKEVEVVEQEAQVNVVLKMYDFDSQLEAILQESSKLATSYLEQNKSEEQIQTALYEYMFTTLNQVHYKKEFSVMIHLVKQNGSWLVSNENEAVIAALNHNLHCLTNIKK